MFSTKKIEVIKTGEEDIPKGNRILLMDKGALFPEYGRCVEQCKFSMGLEPKTIVFRSDSNEKDRHALSWIPKNANRQRTTDQSYLKLLGGHDYQVSITVPASKIEEKIKKDGWCFKMRLLIYRKGEIHGRSFDAFRSHWATTVEESATDTELKEATTKAQKNSTAEKKETNTPAAPNLPALEVSPALAADLMGTTLKRARSSHIDIAELLKQEQKLSVTPSLSPIPDTSEAPADLSSTALPTKRQKTADRQAKDAQQEEEEWVSTVLLLDDQEKQCSPKHS